MALNLSLMTAQSAKGLPDVAITRRTIDFDRGMMANSPALAAPAPGPNLEKVEDFCFQVQMDWVLKSNFQYS